MESWQTWEAPQNFFKQGNFMMLPNSSQNFELSNVGYYCSLTSVEIPICLISNIQTLQSESMRSFGFSWRDLYSSLSKRVVTQNSASYEWTDHFLDSHTRCWNFPTRSTRNEYRPTSGRLIDRILSGTLRIVVSLGMLAVTFGSIRTSH